MNPRAALAVLVLAAPVVLHAQTAPPPGHPSFAGEWVMNRTLSDDAAAKVVEVAGPDYVSGARERGHGP